MEIYGNITGEIYLTEGDVRVRRGGLVDGMIRAENIAIEGMVTGRCEAKSVQIMENYRLNGGCCFVALSIARGGIFSGASEVFTPPSDDDVADFVKNKADTDRKTNPE
nr:polymer-forming cytoskeletal protein [Escherichia coli]